MKQRCINVDWLEVYVLEPPDRYPLDAEYFRRAGFEVKEREYGTRVYAEMFSLRDRDGDNFIEVRRNPLANTKHNERSFLEPYAAHLRMSNKWCYSREPVRTFMDFLVTHNYALKSIYRIDICLDFERFDKGDDPADFMRRYMSGKYTKINQSTIAAHGTDSWSTRVWNSVSWGNRTSMVSTKFYNKTLELDTAHDKPYIRYAWLDAGLIQDPVTMMNRDKDGNAYKPQIWRVEFSIKSSAAKWYVVEDCNGRKTKRINYPHTLDLYDSRYKQLFVFASLCHYYFHFKHFKASVRKDRCPDKVLFDIPTNNIVYRPVRLASERADDRSRLLRLIDNLSELQQYYVDDSVRRSLSNIMRFLQDRLITSDLRDPMEINEVRKVHELFTKSVEQITPEMIAEIDNTIARQIELQFTRD